MDNNKRTCSFLKPDYLSTPDLAVDIIPKIIEQIKLKPGGTLTVGDYGTADGRTSLNIMRLLIEKVKELHGDDYPIQIIYEDCRENDYNALFQNISGGFHECTYMDRFQGIYPMATNIDFYQQCAPPESMDLIFSFCAMHRLSRSPCDIPDSIAIFCTEDEHVKKIWSSQANADWETLLLKRHQELRPGGFFLCAICATHNGLFKLMSDLWKTFVERDVITQKEYEQTNSNIYLRSKEEIRKPFDDPHSKVFSTGMKLVDIYRRTRKVPSYEEFVKAGGTATGYSDMVVKDMVKWSFPVLREGLASSRSDEEKESIIKQFQEVVRETIEEDPTKITYMPTYDMILVQKTQ